MPIIAGSHPLALPGGQGGVTQQAPDGQPLTDVINRFVPKQGRKPPKIKKRAFGAKQAGAAFRK